MFSQNSEEKWNSPYINGKNLYIFAAYLHHKELITKKAMMKKTTLLRSIFFWMFAAQMERRESGR